jgi:hypothetical protein
MSTRRLTLAVLVGVMMAAPGCSAGPAPVPTPVPTPMPTTTPVPTSVSSAMLCQGYQRASASARTPLDAMGKQAVLLPFIDLIELATRRAAVSASAAPDPAVAGAMRELVSAVDAVDAQGQAQLPPGADPGQVLVRLDPARLTGALDRADRACAPHAGPARR